MDLKDWIGRTETADDTVGPVPMAAMAATLDWPVQRPVAGSALPPLWHWLYFLPVFPASEIGEDGHPRRGGFLPPVPLPRRMFAGSRMQYHEPLRVGDALTRVSRILDVSEKSGRSGTLVFVRVAHEIRRNGGERAAFSEVQDIVYREAPRPGDPSPAPQAAPTQAAWERRIVPDVVTLFRYSALTFNGHRIHYDRRYVTEVEGYPGLVVHGPLIATLLLDLLRRERPQAEVAAFEFRAVRPVFDLNPFFVCGAPQPDGRTVQLWARDHEGWLTMSAVATLR